MSGCDVTLARVLWALDVTGPSPAARIVLQHLARMADAKGAVAISRAELSERSQIPFTTMKRQLAELEELRLVARQPQGRANGRQASNLYLVALPTHLAGGLTKSAEGQNRGPFQGAITGGRNRPLDPPEENNQTSQVLPSLTVSSSSSTSSGVGVDVDELTKQARTIAGLPASRTERNGGKWDIDRAEVEGWVKAGGTPEAILSILRDCASRWTDRTGSLRRFDTEVRRALLGVTADPVASVDVTAAFAEVNQRAVCKLFKDGTLEWDDARRRVYGDPPGRPGCKLDPAILAEFGYGDRRAA